MDKSCRLPYVLGCLRPALALFGFNLPVWPDDDLGPVWQASLDVNSTWQPDQDNRWRPRSINTPRQDQLPGSNANLAPRRDAEEEEQRPIRHNHANWLGLVDSRRRRADTATDWPSGPYWQLHRGRSSKMQQPWCNLRRPRFGGRKGTDHLGDYAG